MHELYGNKFRLGLTGNFVKRMRKINYVRNVVGIGCFSLFLAGCSTTPNRAPVVERGSSPVANEVIGAGPVAKPVIKAPENMKGSYVVKRGDTLYRIALDHGQSYSDLVAWNNLKNPNDIKVDQVLRVVPPDLGGEKAAQTSAVTVATPIEVKPLNATVANNKNMPKGDKRSYSDSALAEMQKPDTVAPLIVKNDVIISPKSLEKNSDKSVLDTDVVDWTWPVDGKVMSGFDDAKNKGLDLTGKMGQDVLAAGAGKVVYVGSASRGYGNLVIIKHNASLLSVYAHNKSIVVKEGQTITKGQKIAEMGNSDSESVMLHFEIRLQGKPVDPMKYLPVR